MKKSLIVLMFTATGLCSCGQNRISTADKVTGGSETMDSTDVDQSQDTLAFDPDTYIHTQSIHTDSTGKDILIQNSYPRGGTDIDKDGLPGYTDASGKSHAYVLLWTRILNETATPFELTINFPADSFAVFTPPNSYLKLFLPPDTMTLDKVSDYDFGIKDLSGFLDSSFQKPTILQRTINPNEDCVFYIAALSYQAGGTVRAGLVLKEHALFYKIGIYPHGSALIPCGQIEFKN